MSYHKMRAIGVPVAIIVAVSFIPLMLRLDGAIHWSWWWVLCPFWGVFALLFLLSVIVTVIEALLEFKLRRRQGRRDRRSAPVVAAAADAPADADPQHNARSADVPDGAVEPGPDRPA
jgi:hypothetical protein